MAQIIFKYPIEVTDEQVIEIPNGAKILTIQTQKRFPKGDKILSHSANMIDLPCIWAMVNEGAGIGKKKIVMFGTGHHIESSKNLEYIGSFQTGNGTQIYHTFEEK